MFVLHVGPHKTATTWMQVNLHHNIKVLQKAGWLYPQTGERVVIAHHDMSDQPQQIMNANSSKVAAFRRIAKKASDEGLDIVMSSEGFRKWRPAHLKRLQKIMAPHEMRIVYTVRDPVSLVYSLWAQMVKTGNSSSFPAFQQRQLAMGRKSTALNPMGELICFSSIKGAGLTILLYDEIVRQKRDIFDVFTQEVLKIGPLAHVQMDTANERQPLEMTEFMRLLLNRVGRWKGKENVNIGRVFHHMLTGDTKRKIIDAVGAVTDARRTMVIRRDEPKLLRVERQLVKKYSALMIPPPGEKIFLEGDQACLYYDDAQLSADPKVAALLDDLQKKFRPGGIRMRFANAARWSLLHWRRVLNRFR